MKRIIAIVMCVLMLLFSASCGKKGTNADLESTISQPTQMPTAASTEGQTVTNTSVPTTVPTVQPTTAPTVLPPTTAPTEGPTAAPTEGPTAAPTVKPTSVPTIAPTAAPTVKPTTVPTVAPTQKPTTAPTVLPTVKPTVEPTVPVTIAPTVAPTIRPQPTITPITKPTEAPTTAPTEPVAYYTYYDSYGNSVQLPEGVDVFDYTLSQAKLPQAVSKYPAIEQKIFELTNAERAKQGLAPLALEEKAYYFAATRAYEAAVQWSHTRPNGEPYYHILAEYKVIGSSGENLYYIQGVDADYVSSPANVDFLAENAITGWMNSSGHRANILNANWSSMAVGVYYDAQTQKLVSVQLFFA